MVLPLHYFGLGNRLRTMSCANILVEDGGRMMAVDWEPSAECNVRFEELFNLTHARAAGVLDVFDRAANLPVIMHIDETSKVTMETDLRTIPLQANSVNSKPIIDTLLSYPDPIVFQTTGMFRPRHISCQALLVRRSAFYKALRPVQGITDVVDRYYHSHMRRHLVVGMHIRVNADFDYPHIPDFSNTVRTWGETAPVELFEQVCAVLGRTSEMPCVFELVC